MLTYWRICTRAWKYRTANLAFHFLKTIWLIAELKANRKTSIGHIFISLPHPYFSARGEFQFEKFARDPFTTGPYGIETASAPVNISFFHPSGVFAKLTTTFVQQKVKSRTPENSGVDDFALLEPLAVGYRLPKRRGIVGLEGRNLMDEHFLLQERQFPGIRTCSTINVSHPPHLVFTYYVKPEKK